MASEIIVNVRDSQLESWLENADARWGGAAAAYSWVFGESALYPWKMYLFVLQIHGVL